MEPLEPNSQENQMGQSSIDKKPIPPKEIESRAWRLVKGPWRDSHDHEDKMPKTT
jgi:hypothetical protein